MFNVNWLDLRKSSYSSIIFSFRPKSDNYFKTYTFLFYRIKVDLNNKNKQPLLFICHQGNNTKVPKKKTLKKGAPKFYKDIRKTLWFINDNNIPWTYRSIVWSMFNSFDTGIDVSSTDAWLMVAVPDYMQLSATWVKHNLDI